MIVGVVLGILMGYGVFVIVYFSIAKRRPTADAGELLGESPISNP